MRAKGITQLHVLFQFLVIGLFINTKTKAQVNITNDGSLPHSSAQLEVKSSNKGLLLPRIATPTSTVASPAAGLLVFDQNKAGMAFYDGAGWKNVSGNETLLERFPNSRGFTSTFNTGVAGSPNVTEYTWVVPAGVNNIWVEAWGGGRAGTVSNTLSAIRGGAGGDYLSTIIPVTAGNTMWIRVSKGETNGNTYGNTQVYPNLNVTSVNLSVSSGGVSSSYKLGSINDELINWIGGEPSPSGNVSYQNLGTTGYIFAQAPGGGAYPSYTKASSNTFIFNASKIFVEDFGTSNYGSIPGGGAPAVALNDFSYGGPGLVILHW